MEKILQKHRLLLVMAAFILGVASYGQSAGFNNTFIVLSINGGSNAYYDLNGSTANPDFNGIALGAFCQGSSGIVFKGAEHNVYKCGTCDITSTRINYRIYPTGSPSGSFVTNNIGYTSDFANGCGGRDQKWSATGYSANLLSGLSPGSYTIEVYSDESTTCFGTVYASNGGANYKATFTINANVTYYADADSDGFGNPSVAQTTCTGAPAGYVANSSDCNDAKVLYQDTDGDGFGSTTKVACGGADNNTDCNDAQLRYQDSDGDGFGSLIKVACGGVTNNTDCNDSQLQYVDNDNDGFGSVILTGCGVANNTDCNDAQLRYVDVDGEGFGSTTFTACGGANNSTDCDDLVLHYTDADGDGFGSLPYVNCGGVLNQSDCNDAVLNYVDLDGDGFGSTTFIACGGANNSTDCDDLVLHYTDADGDGFGGLPYVNCGGVLNQSDCNDAVLNYVDSDGDGFGSTTFVACGGVANNTDCNDNDSTIFQLLSFYTDGDGDGYGIGNTTAVCAGNATVPAGYATNNTDCDDTKNTVHPNALEIGYNLIDDDCDGSVDEGFPPKVTVIQSTQCNNTLSAIDAYLYANIVAGAQGYRWRITTMTGPGAGQVQFINTALRAVRLTQLGVYAFNTTYKIEVAVFYAGYQQPFTASACTVSTPATTTTLAACGQTLTAMSDVIYSNLVSFAGGYRFRISDPANPLASQEIDRPLREFNMNLITAFPVLYGKPYNVQVALKNTDGSYLPYGGTCTVNTPLFPTTSLQDSQCDDYAVLSMSTQVFAYSYPGAIGYAFKLTGPGLPAGGMEVVKSIRAFALNSFTGLIPGATYDVRCRLIFNNADLPGPYGKTCRLIVPALSRITEQAEAVMDAVAYPIPFADSFNIDIVSLAGAKAAVKIYDMAGRLLESQSVPGGVQSVKAGEGFPSGVYNVVVSQGDETRSLRVVKR